MRWIGLFLMLGLAACQSTKRTSQGPEGLLGTSYADFKAGHGEPIKSLGNLHVYAPIGMLVYTDPKEQRIIGLVAGWFQGGTGFSGKLAGLALGDTWPFCLQKLGEPSYRRSGGPDYDEALWDFPGQRLRIEIWTQDGTDTDLGGSYLAETVKRIQWSVY